MATIITNINPYTLETQVYSDQDLNLIAFRETPSQFIPNQNYVEYTILSPNQAFQITDQNFLDYKITNNTSPAGSDLIYNIDINPENDLTTRGFTNGEYNVIYNFLNNELYSSSDNRAYYIKDISSDRTEIRIASNTLNNVSIEAIVNSFISNRDLSTYFQDFYLNFGSNNLVIANNILLDTTKPQYEILINLYEALPSQFRLKDTLWVVTQVADPLAFNLQFQPEVIIPQITNPTIKGPNFDLPLKDRINNSSNYINYEELLTTGLATSQQQIISYLQDNSIAIGTDYSSFENFVHFSSAQSRIENFYYKIQLIEQYNADITTLGTSTSSSISESIAILQSKVDNIIKNFDGYEYWSYYSSGSTSYPKATTSPPYALYASNDTLVTTWYNDLIESASIYDQNNQDYLINTIPDYLLDDPQNEPYQVFLNMIGQHYDNLWIYYKDVTNRYNGDNRLDHGISKDLVADALRSFGLKIYQNNFSTNDLYNAFTGFNVLPSGSAGGIVNNGNVYVVSPYIVEGDYGYFLDDVTYTYSDPTELITNYVTASQEALYEPLDDVNKEIYKRLYHNLPLLLKQKGTIAGLRNLINVYGIPDTILRISEFGGRDKDTSTYDYFYQQYNYQFVSDDSGQIKTSWALNPKWITSSYNGTVGGYSVPESIQFRFKTKGIAVGQTAPASQTLFSCNGTGNPSIILNYTGSGNIPDSYGGAIADPYYQYAKLDFIPNSATPNATASIYLPFYDGGWWSIMVNWTAANTFKLYAGNKLEYDGYDGNQLGFYASSSVSSSDSGWQKTDTTQLQFNGSYQELRYFSQPISESSFKDFVMNPNSIDTQGENEYSNYLAFRIPLGGELYTGSLSIHPKVTGSWIATSSFDPALVSLSLTSSANFTNAVWSTNIEEVFFNSPTAGLRNRVTDKIQIVSQDLPQINLQYTQSGNTLSQYRSIQQQYVISGSETPDVNALEVAFSPQNEIDDDIIDSLGYFNIGNYIGDPRQVFTPNTSYPDLDTLRQNFFQKYTDRYDLFDYIRLIKFFDNSLFKMIKDFVPARTNLRSGVVVKQHLLERNKYPQPMMDWEDVTYTGSIDTAFFSGSTGGTFNEFNVLSDGSFNIRTAPTLNASTYVNILTSVNFNPLFSPTFSDYFQLTDSGEIMTNIETNFRFRIFAASIVSINISSSLQGNIEIFPSSIFTYTTSSIISCSYGEKFKIFASASSTGGTTINLSAVDINPYSQQTWPEFELGPSGSTYLIREDQREFYNGELPGTIIEVSNGELNIANVFKYPSTLEIDYTVILYKDNYLPLNDFTNINTSPNQGEIYLYYDSGYNPDR